MLVYAAIEGVFIGMISKYLRVATTPGIVAQAVLGTFAAAGVTLAAYKFFNIRVTAEVPEDRDHRDHRVRRGHAAQLRALAAPASTWACGTASPARSACWPIGISLLGAVLAVLNLVLDFDYIEKGVAMGAPASESWRGAFGLTVTMVWLYIEILRLLSYLRR